MTLPAADIIFTSDDAVQSLARDMIEVHGANAADIARDNARRAAVAAQLPQARHWLKVLDFIQREHRVEATTQPRGPQFPSAISSDH